MNSHPFISKLNLVNFKNYTQLELELSPDINCFIGENGAGKTNILDAVHYLSVCKSYLNPVDSQNIQFDESFFVVQGVWNKNEKLESIYCGVKRGQKKVFRKNKVDYEKLADHIGQYPSVMISPYDRNLIVEGSDVRRKWMDGIISQFDRNYLNHLIKYRKIVEQRNALLKSIPFEGFFDRERMSVWDEQMIQSGEVIYKARKEILKAFIPIFKKYYRWLSNSKEEVDLEYKTQLAGNTFDELLKQYEEEDRRKQYSGAGIHRDDFVFTINGYPIKKFGSQGQQKSYLIALKLAQYDWLRSRLEEKPVLLLDDIFDKLDNQRVERLMQMVHQHDFGQVLITDTDEQRVQSIFEENNIAFKSFFVKENSIANKVEKTVEA